MLRLLIGWWVDVFWIFVCMCLLGVGLVLLVACWFCVKSYLEFWVCDYLCFNLWFFVFVFWGIDLMIVDFVILVWLLIIVEDLLVSWLTCRVLCYVVLFYFRLVWLLFGVVCLWVFSCVWLSVCMLNWFVACLGVCLPFVVCVVYKLWLPCGCVSCLDYLLLGFLLQVEISICLLFYLYVIVLLICYCWLDVELVCVGVYCVDIDLCVG